MITRLHIRNWRNYENLELDLRAGATFIVAANGVGKTSLIEAVRWGIFGLVNSSTSPNGAVRAGANEASVEVTIDLGDQGTLIIYRTLPKRPVRTSLATVTLNGRDLANDRLDSILADAFEASYKFLSRLVVPHCGREQTRIRPDQMGLEQHLGTIYGVDNLRDAIAVLDDRIRDNDKAIKRVKEAHKPDPDRLQGLRGRVEETRALQDAQQLELNALEHESGHAREIEEATRRHTEWAALRNRRDQSLRELVPIASEVLGAPVTATDLSTQVAQGIDTLTDEARTVQVDQGITRTRIESLEANRARLDEAHEDCPVCRRPLDGATIDFAHDTTETEIATLQARLASLAEDEQRTLGDLTATRNLQQRIRQIPTLPTEPKPPQPTELIRATDELGNLVQDARNSVITASTDHRRARDELNAELTAASATKYLMSLWQENAHLHAVKDATHATLTELLEGTIDPLAGEITQRWAALFPGRGQISTTPSGDIVRNLDGVELSFDAFSAGEGTGAILLLRLLVIQMATAASFCWFDEPLEHLDPEARRDVANLLSRVTQTEGPLRQVVVTTYEDQLAQRLHDRDPAHVHLQYIRLEDRDA